MCPFLLGPRKSLKHYVTRTRLLAFPEGKGQRLQRRDYGGGAGLVRCYIARIEGEHYFCGEGFQSEILQNNPRLVIVCICVDSGTQCSGY
jgi:hypothetical protein